MAAAMTAHIVTHAKTQPTGKTQNASHHCATHQAHAQET
jgi:hypothetical protein